MKIILSTLFISLPFTLFSENLSFNYNNLFNPIAGLMQNNCHIIIFNNVLKINKLSLNVISNLANENEEIFAQKKVQLSTNERKTFSKYIYLVIVFLLAIIFLLGYFFLKTNKKCKILMLELDYLACKKEAMIYQVNPHFIFNILNSIQFNIKNNDYETTSIYISKFSRYLRLALEHYQQNYISFSAEIEFVKLYLELEQTRLRNKFIFKIQKFNDFNPDKYQIPPLLIQPFVENAIWLGFFEKQITKEYEIIINLKEEENFLYCELLDNGLDYQDRNMYNHEKSVKSILLTKKRIEIYNILYKSNIELTVERYKKELEFNTGTRVLFKMPAFINT